MRRLAVALIALVLLLGDMYPDASNSTAPAATNLGVGTGTALNVTSPDFGGRGDGRGGTDGTIALGSANFSSASAAFAAADVGKLFILEGAGAAGAPLVTTIAAYTSPTQVTLAGPSQAALPYNFATGCTVSTAQSGAGSYAPGDTVTISGGTGTATQCTVRTTKVLSATIVAGGTGGDTGACILTGTTGTTHGKDDTLAGRFRIEATIAGGAVTALGAVTVDGQYTANPANLANEPVRGCNLTGATLSVKMGPGPMTVSVRGAYTTVPTNPAATTTSGSGTGLTVSLVTLPPRYKYGTNNRDAFAAAISALSAAQQPGALRIPAGVYLIDGAALPVLSRGTRVVGDGSFATWIDVSPAYAGAHVFGVSNAWGGNPVGANPFSGTALSADQQTTGFSLIGIAVVGFRSSVVQQSALTFYDHADHVFVSDLLCWFVTGSCIRSGVLKNDTNSYIRESHLQNIRASNSGSAGTPVIDINTAESVSGGVTSNELDITNVDIYGNYGCGLALRSANSLLPVRSTLTFRIVNLRIEGIENNPNNIKEDLLCIGDATLGGQTSNAYFKNTKLINPYEGKCALRTAAISAARKPYAINFDGWVAGGASYGKGFCLDSLRNSSFSIYGIVTADANITATDQVSSTWINGYSNEASWTYDVDPVALPRISSVISTAATRENRFFNPDYLVDQFFGGTAHTPSVASAGDIDGWSHVTTQVGQFSQERTTGALPFGFTTGYKFTTVGTGISPAATDRMIWRGHIEYARLSDLWFGYADNTLSVIVSKYFRSSIAGNIAVSLGNNFGGSPSRSYVVRCALPANVWTQCAWRVPVDIAGPWGTSGANVLGLQVAIDLGSGSNFETTPGYWQPGQFYRSAGDLRLVSTPGATLEMTNARLYPSPLPVPYTPRTAQQTLIEAQRYYRTSFPAGVVAGTNKGVAGARCLMNPAANGLPSLYIPFDPPMRSTPSVTTYNSSASNFDWRNVTRGTNVVVSEDPSAAAASTGIQIGVAAPVTTAGDNLCIHYTANAGP